MAQSPYQSHWFVLGPGNRNPWLYWTLVVLFLLLVWKTIGVCRQAWRQLRLRRRRRQQLRRFYGHHR